MGMVSFPVGTGLIAVGARLRGGSQWIGVGISQHSALSLSFSLDESSARQRSTAQIANEVRCGEARRGEATHPMLFLTEQSASSLSHRDFYGGIGLSLVAVVSRESQWDWFDL
uniref:Uncharacterized protein n=1 Tax=Fagus sylvatica TaxID=28930 RepID=A0A2N9EL33_FAGSY